MNQRTWRLLTIMPLAQEMTAMMIRRTGDNTIKTTILWKWRPLRIIGCLMAESIVVDPPPPLPTNGRAQGEDSLPTIVEIDNVYGKVD